PWAVGTGASARISTVTPSWSRQPRKGYRAQATFFADTALVPTPPRLRYGPSMRRFAVLVVLAACAPAAPPVDSPPAPSASVAPQPSALPTPDPRAMDAAAFAELSSRFVRGYLQRSPVAATNAGLHDYDANWP